jgi:GntR family transcriptional regulator, uxu operon transcriptional repressor
MTRHLTNIRDALMEASKAKSMATTKPANSRGKIR